MFNFTWIGKNKIKSIMEVIEADIEELQISKMAIEKAVSMIAKAVAKSEFVVQRKNGKVKDDIYYMLNVKANENETATDFWIEVIRRLLIESECVICRIGKSLYVADSWQVDASVVLEQKYTNIVITSNGNDLQLDKTFYANEVLHLRSRNEKIQSYMKKIFGKYDEILDALSEAKRITSTPKFELLTKGLQPLLRSKNPDGTDKTMTVDEYKEKIKKLLTSKQVEIITNQDTITLGELKIANNVSTEDITKIAHEIFIECALAFDIPKAVFLGEITEKADSTNEFITYAVSWVVEVINDSLNAKLVGQKDYLNGEKIWIDMSGYKHVDIIESAGNLDKLRAIGFSLDEIFKMVGWEELGTEFSKQRVVTKNYTNDLNEGS
ncbi:phage portal protein [Faecalimonas sp.]